MLTNGTTTVERAIIPPRQKTIIEGLLYFFITPVITVRKTKIPRPDQMPIHRANFTYKLPKSQKVRVFENALNIIIYIPVAAATYGGTPMPINTGLNTTPPPSPTALASPPPNDASTILSNELPEYWMSDLLVPILVSCLIFSSLYTLFTCR